MWRNIRVYSMTCLVLAVGVSGICFLLSGFKPAAIPSGFGIGLMVIPALSFWYGRE